MFIKIIIILPHEESTMTLHGHMSCFSNIFAVKIILISIFLFTFSSIYRAKASGMNYQPWKKIIQISVTGLRISTGWWQTSRSFTSMNENLKKGLLRGNPANFHARHYTWGLWITFLSSAAITAFCRLESPFVAKKKQTSNFSF